MKCDYLIIGQGLAGSVLAFYLLDKNCNVLVMDDPNLPKSSTVAAGIYNPFTGRKLVKTWMADLLFPLIERFYNKMQNHLETKFLHSMPMYRPFLSQKEQNDWVIKTDDPDFSRYIANVVPPSDALPGIVNPLGGMMLDKCGFLDIQQLIKSMRDYLQNRGLLKLEHFDEACLEVREDNVRYQDIQAKRVVFCDGAFLTKSKWFEWLPLRPVKGEILTIELEGSLDYIVNRGVFVLPVGGKKYKVGATFDNKEISLVPTVKAREQLIYKLEKLVSMPYRIKDHVAGIRPATADRRPFIGLHPKFEPLAVFNGLGTKGVSLAPFLAREFFEFFEQGRPLIPEVAITRHFSLYYNKF